MHDISERVLRNVHAWIVLVHGRPASFGQDHGGSVTSKFGPMPLYLRAAATVAAFRPGEFLSRFCVLSGPAMFNLDVPANKVSKVATPSGRC